jgi:predicted acylesterase/phospholipase RssA
VKSGKAAVGELRERLGREPGKSAGWKDIPEQYPFVGAGPPAGFTTEPPGEGDVWGGSETVPPLRDPAAYALDGLESELGLTPAVGLGMGRSREQRESFCGGSIDVTMRGGTTSGVVYPMAVCELARGYRLRNIGGASAGAIAAAAAAAAEAGRSGGFDASPIPSAEARGQGHVRAGFAGFADCMAWLAQVDSTGPDEFRVGQLFRPTQQALPLFRLVVAYMRHKYLAIPALFAGAFGWVSKWANILIAAAALVISGLVLGRHAVIAQYRRGSLLRTTSSHGGHDSAWQLAGRYAWALGQGALGLIAVTVLVAGVVMTLLVVRGRRAKDGGPEEMKEPVLTIAEPGAGLWAPAALLVGGVAGLGLDRLVLGVPLIELTAVWLFAVVAVGVVAIASVLLLVTGAERHSFGLVSGSSPPVGRSLWNRVAGMPKATVSRPLVQWLSETISELAGLDEKTPLRFGHLWFGREYEPSGDADPKTLEAFQTAATDLRHRLINLELVTTELVQGLGYKFPLPPGAEMESETDSALYLRRRDLEAPGAEIFPRAVVDALCTAPPELNVYDRRSGDLITDLHRLPEQWDLPVIFAVRLSMSLPCLLEAVRVYRISKYSSTVRDEFGLPVSGAAGSPLMYPSPSNKHWAEELWFSDGGITSNFPIHLFDSLFPLWPTVGINLSKYPTGFRHQDVWLPQDWQAHQVVGAPVKGGMGGFAGAIIDAARGWRDTAQSQMPSYVGRIATVRQSKTEGGTNLFMARETIAALALRGELAGARLRRRFTSPWWQRNQWLRFRTAIGNLEELRDEIRASATAKPYAGLASGSGTSDLATLKNALTLVGDPDAPPAGPNWCEPASAFWPGAGTLLAAISAVPAAQYLRNGVPKPEPDLKQVPPS